jgi:hypothetical protein
LGSAAAAVQLRLRNTQSRRCVNRAQHCTQSTQLAHAVHYQKFLQLNIPRKPHIMCITSTARPAATNQAMISSPYGPNSSTSGPHGSVLCTAVAFEASKDDSMRHMPCNANATKGAQPHSCSKQLSSACQQPHGRLLQMTRKRLTLHPYAQPARHHITLKAMQAHCIIPPLPAGIPIAAGSRMPAAGQPCWGQPCCGGACIHCPPPTSIGLGGPAHTQSLAAAAAAAAAEALVTGQQQYQQHQQNPCIMGSAGCSLVHHAVLRTPAMPDKLQ